MNKEYRGKASRLIYSCTYNEFTRLEVETNEVHFNYCWWVFVYIRVGWGSYISGQVVLYKNDGRAPKVLNSRKGCVNYELKLAKSRIKQINLYHRKRQFGKECNECGQKRNGSIDEENGLFYCNQCWDQYEAEMEEVEMEKKNKSENMEIVYDEGEGAVNDTEL